MKSKLISFFSVLLIVYVLVAALLYFFQERMIFFPQRLAEDFAFEHYEHYEERFIKMQDGTQLHALYFQAENSKGVVLYLHGNAGSLEGWGSVATTFTACNYDVFIPDYRSYGKSGGAIESEVQLHEDMQAVYDHLITAYPEKQIIVLGHSIGSGMAARLAARNDPKLLILQAPPYSLPDLSKKLFPFNLFPQFLIRYKFETGKYLAATDVPVVILHGNEDAIVYYGSSLKLKEHFKITDTLITLRGLGHNDFLETGQYRSEISRILESF